MFRFISNLTVVERLVIAVVAMFLSTFVIDETQSRAAARRGVDDARHDIAAGNFSFRVGGRRSPWFTETAISFRDRYGADLVCSSGCCPTCADSSCDSAFNATMAKALSKKFDGFDLDDAYRDADAIGRKKLEDRLAAR